MTTRLVRAFGQHYLSSRTGFGVNSRIHSAMLVGDFVANHHGHPSHQSLPSLSLSRLLCSSPLTKYKPFAMELLKFLQSEAISSEGPFYRWLNRASEDGSLLSAHGTTLLIMDPFFQGSKQRSESRSLLQRMKEMQVRLPSLHILGIQYVKDLDDMPENFRIHNLILQEFITFPILLCSKDYHKATNISVDHHAFLINGCNELAAYNYVDMDLESILSGILGQLKLESNHSNSEVCSERTIEYVEEPALDCTWKDTLLCFPGSVSADEDGNRLFISDSNHHRVIVVDGFGNVLDCIGSFPGFEDGPFESAQLCCPASTLFDSELNCLYIADSENHAIRKANLSERKVEPIVVGSSKSGKFGVAWRFFFWLRERLGVKHAVTGLPNGEEEGLKEDDKAVLFPWHLSMAGNGHLAITSRRISQQKVICRRTGKWKSKSNCQEELKILSEKTGWETSINLLKEILSSRQSSITENLDSRIATMKGTIYIADTDHHRILKFEQESMHLTTLKLLKLGTLGMPPWWSYPVDLLSSKRSKAGQETEKDERSCKPQVFHIRPGRCQLSINVNLPKGAVFAAPVEDDCIWRQARGSIVELSMLDGLLLSEKITGAQQWYDDIENFEFLDASLSDEIEDADTALDIKTLQQSQSSLCVYTLFDAGLGTGEVIVDGALYLRYECITTCNGEVSDSRRINNGCRNRQSTCNPTVLDNSLVSSIPGNNSLKTRVDLNDCCMWSDANMQNLQDQVFIKRLHVRVRFQVSNSAPSERMFEVCAYLNL